MHILSTHHDARDANLLPAPFVAAPAGIPITQWNLNPQLGPAPCAADPLACFVNPLLLQSNVYESTAGALYNAGILEVKKRFSSHFTLFPNYTYSKAQDDVTDYNADFAANDETNLRGERALSAFDQIFPSVGIRVSGAINRFIDADTTLGF